MALQLECPACHCRSPATRRKCHRCGHSLKAAAWWTDATDGAGKRHRIRAIYKETAQRLDREIREARLRGEPWQRHPPDTRGPLLGKVVDEYLSHAMLSKRGDSRGIPIRDMKDYKQRRSAIERAVKRLGADLPVKEVTTQRIHQYQQQRLQDGISHSSLNRETVYLHGALAWAARLGHIEANPMKGYDAKPENPARERILSPAEYRALCDELEGETLALFILRYHLPLRQEETLALKWAMVVTDGDARGRIELPGSITKSGRARVVPFYRAEAREAVLSLPTRFRRTGPLWTLTARDFREALNTAKTRAKVADFTARDLKHCAVTEMVAAGMPVHLISDAADHKSAWITDRYTNLSAQHIRQWGQRWRWDQESGTVVAVGSAAGKSSG